MPQPIGCGISVRCKERDRSDGNCIMGSNYDKQLQRAKESFLCWDSRSIEERFSLLREGKWLYVPYLARLHRIDCETGDVEEQQDEGWGPGSFGAHMAIFDAFCREKMGTLGKRWSTVNNLEGLYHPGVGEATMYGNLALAFSGRVEKLRQIGRQWGAEPFPVGDVAFVLPIFPFLPVVFQFWEGDEEFSPQIRLLWDNNTLTFLSYETVWYVAADLLGTIAGKVKFEKSGPNAQI